MFTFAQTKWTHWAYLRVWEVMLEYRAYTLDEDGHIIGCEPVVCAGDDEAIASAERLVDGRDIELWAGVRLIIRLEPPSKA
jgi:hypothetical protein